MEDEHKRSSVEPVGYVSGFYGGYCVIQPTDPAVALPVGAALSYSKEWVGLTDEEIHDMNGYEEDRRMYRFARAIEAKLKEKNHG